MAFDADRALAEDPAEDQGDHDPLGRERQETPDDEMGGSRGQPDAPRRRRREGSPWTATSQIARPIDRVPAIRTPTSTIPAAQASSRRAAASGSRIMAPRGSEPPRPTSARSDAAPEQIGQGEDPHLGDGRIEERQGLPHEQELAEPDDRPDEDRAEGDLRRRSERQRRPPRRARPSSTSFSSEAKTRSASERPDASSSMPSWIIVSSRWVSGLSTGWWPVSATTTIAKATAARRWVGPSRPRPARRPNGADRAEVARPCRERGTGQREHERRARPARRWRRRGCCPSRRTRRRRRAPRGRGRTGRPPAARRRRTGRPSRRAAAARQRRGRGERRRAIDSEHEDRGVPRDRPRRAALQGRLAPPLGEVPVRLDEGRSAAALEPRLRPPDRAGEKRREGEERRRAAGRGEDDGR